MPVQIGLDRCLAEPPRQFPGARFGLLMNQASVNPALRYACDLLATTFPGQLKALFSPQHGLWCEEQANMIESAHSRYAPLDLPIFSLYSLSREPAPEMLADIDCLLIDLQDVGTRVYTFAWTIQNCLRACAAAHKAVVLLDRPNPLGGQVAEGPLLDPDYLSFVGGATIPMRHGLTLGELARLLNAEQQIGADLTVVPMRGWRRNMFFSATDLPWVAPSPNMPRITTALLYPGQVILEGTNLSEGRGTTLPFELLGAPFIDPHRLTAELNALELPGVVGRAVRFIPTFDKFQGQRCGGVALHVLDASRLRSFELTLHLLALVRHLCPGDFALLPPPYEYERIKMPLDILYGSSQLRSALLSDSAPSHATIKALSHLDDTAWWNRVRPYLLYD